MQALTACLADLMPIRPGHTLLIPKYVFAQCFGCEAGG